MCSRRIHADAVRSLLGIALLLFVPMTGYAEAFVPLPPQPHAVAWPSKSWPTADLSASVDARALRRAVDALFESAPPGGPTDTRALVVVHGGQIVLERYAEGFGQASLFHSWSMAKGFLQCLVALLVQSGDLEIDAPVPVAAWARADDPRQRLTLRQLLNLTTGLDNADGGADPSAFIGRLYYGPLAQDMARNAAAVPLIHEPGTHWAYSSGTSAILGGIISSLRGPDRASTRRWMEKELFEPMGITSLIAETDSRGHIVGGSHVWANARDWARLGLLYLRDGVWDGQRILPVGWVDFTRTRAPAQNNGTYGAHFWLNLEPGEDQFQPLPGAPASAFQMSGNGGQYVAMVPDYDLVVVRLGEMRATDWPTVGDQMGVLISSISGPPGDAP